MSTFKSWLYDRRNDDDLQEFAEVCFSLPGWDGTQKRLWEILPEEWHATYGECLRRFRKSKVRHTRVRSKEGYVLTYGQGGITFRHAFRTKAEIKDYYQKLKDQIGDSGRGLVMTQEEQCITKALFVHHHKYLVQETEDFTIQRNLSGQWSWFVNGEPISYVKCINYIGKDSVEKQRINAIHEFLKACRDCIADQSAIIPRARGEQIDHVNFFNGLVRDWLKENGFHISEIPLTENYPRVLEEPYHKSWSEYHKAHAVLRPLDAVLNSKRQPKPVNWLVYF